MFGWSIINSIKFSRIGGQKLIVAAGQVMGSWKIRICEKQIEILE